MYFLFLSLMSGDDGMAVTGSMTIHHNKSQTKVNLYRIQQVYRNKCLADEDLTAAHNTCSCRRLSAFSSFPSSVVTTANEAYKSKTVQEQMSVTRERKPKRHNKKTR